MTHIVTSTCVCQWFGGDFLKNKYSDFGKAVKKRLIDLNKIKRRKS